MNDFLLCTLPRLFCACIVACATQAVAQPTLKVGLGTVYLSPKSGDNRVPSAQLRTEAMAGTPAQSAKWYSTILYSAKPEALFVQPITVKPTTAGLELALPTKEVVPTVRRDTEIRYPHQNPLVLKPIAFRPGQAKLAKASDWAVDVSMAQGADDFTFTVAHGSPYVHLRISRGDVAVQLPQDARAEVALNDPQTLVVKGSKASYAVYGPMGSVWANAGPATWTLKLASGKTYLSAAALPDLEPATLTRFKKHAFAFVTDTKVDWVFNAQTSQVETTFTTTTQNMEGDAAGPLMGLYPHHWHNNASLTQAFVGGFDTVRGRIQLLPASSFKKTLTYHGFVPHWPAVKDPAQQAMLAELTKVDQRNARRMMLEEGKGPYWQGKGLLRILKLMDVLEQQGDREGRDRLLGMVKKRMESWFTGEDGGYFHWDRGQGVVASYPEEFFTVEQLNDHHFTYGYWIRAAAEIALRDPAWAAPDQWGAMVDLLVADIATAQRDSKAFPFLRNFDPYEGHSWASGIGLGPHGNNQESSSEAVNAWISLVLWGEIKGDRKLRDLGIYLMTSEIDAINHYWFDVHGLVLAPEYKNREVSMLFGGMYAHNTWWTDEPRQIKGINLLPITTASTYLGRYPDYVKRNVASLAQETALYNARGLYAKPADIWQDIFAKYMALADPAAGLSMWNRWGSFELGDTRSFTAHYLQSLVEMGTPDFSVTADTSFYAVFKKSDGRKTYSAYNVGQQPVIVNFSDGKTLTVQPRSLGKL